MRWGVNLRHISLSSSSYLYTENDEALGVQDKVTIGFWVSPENTPGREQFLVSHGSWEERYKISLSPDMTLRWTVNTSDGTNGSRLQVPLDLNKFYHITAVYTGYSMELYVNGEFYSFMKRSWEISELRIRILLMAEKIVPIQNILFAGIFG